MELAFNTLYKPVFFQDVPTLQNLVICKMVQYTWHNEMLIQRHKGNLTTFLDECNFLQATVDFRCQKVKLLWNVPWEETQLSRYFLETTVSLSEQTKIQINMELYAWNLTREFDYWMCFHGFELFQEAGVCNYSVVKLLYRFDGFVYDVYGRIDYEKTAKNLFVCGELTQCQKFIISCIYCFEEEVEQLWPLVQMQMQLLNPVIDDYDDLVLYWITQKTNQPSTVLPSAMFAQHSQTYSAMKYFCKNITTFDEKVNCIGLCFEYKNMYACVECINYWFPKMNEEFLRRVISRYGTTIMIFLIQAVSCHKFILSFWQHTGDMFDGDQFINILEGINALNFRDFKLMCRVLWCNAPTKLKTHALNHYQIEDFFDPLNSLMKRIYTQNPYNIDKKGTLMIPSDQMYYPNDCQCRSDSEGKNCECKTLLQ